MGNEKPGLRIIYSRSSEGESSVLTASIQASVGKYSQNFITTPEIRNALSKYNFHKGSEVGKLVIAYNPAEKSLSWRHYFPIPHLLGTPIRSFRNAGIASMIEAHVNKEIERVFPHAKKVYHDNPSPKRQEQLFKRGFTTAEIAKGFRQKDFSKAMRDKLANDIRKARTKRRA